MSAVGRSTGDEGKLPLASCTLVAFAGLVVLCAFVMPAAAAAGEPETAGPVDTTGFPTEPGAAIEGPAVDPVLVSATENGTAVRTGDEVVLTVPGDRIDDAGPVTLSVTGPAADGAAVVTAEHRSGGESSNGSYRAQIPVTELVGPTVDTGLSNATVRASHDGAAVLEAETDLRYLASRSRASFRGTTLALPVDARGLGEPSVALELAGSEGPLNATLEGSGPNATILVAPRELRGVDAAPVHEATPVVDGNEPDPTSGPTGADGGEPNGTDSDGTEPIPGEPLAFSIADAAGRASALSDGEGGPLLHQPLVHPALGPERVVVRVDTDGPEGTFRSRAGSESGTVPVPESVLLAEQRRVSVVDGNATLVDGVPVGLPGQRTIALQVENGTLRAPEPAELDGVEALLVRRGEGEQVESVHLPIEDQVRAGEPQALPTELADVDEDASALAIGTDGRVGPAELSVVVPDASPTPSEPDAPEADAFVGLWVDIGNGVLLLVLAMVGAVAAVGAAYVVRLASPARSEGAGLGAVAGHFLLGGIGGVATIAAIQALWTGPLVGTVEVGGLTLGLGALLVGTFHGGLTAVGLRVGLGTTGAWPTRRLAGPTVPVSVEVTDDGGNPLAGDPTVAVQHVRGAAVLATASVSGTTATLELPAGDYRLLARTGQRETDPVEVTVPDPAGHREPVTASLTVPRPSLQIEVTDAETDRSVPTADVTVTTDRGETTSVAAEAGSASVALPLAAGTVTVVVEARRFETATVEQPIDEQLTTLDVALDPAAGTLVATALVDGEPLPSATVLVEPAEDDPPAVGERTAALTPETDGLATADLPVGRYRLRLDLDGPNAQYFAVTDGEVELGRDEQVETAVRARFDWTVPERHRQRAARIRETVRSVRTEATADPTVPLYFASVAEALLALLDALSESGPQFADSAHDPDDVAAAVADAAGATLQAVGHAMQAEGVAPVLAAGGEPERVRPEVEATPETLLAHLGRDVTVATVESRATRVRERIDAEADRLPTVAPARAVASVAVRLPRGVDAPIQVATREFAAVLLLDAVEECFDHAPLRRRFAGASSAERRSGDEPGGGDRDGDHRKEDDEEALEEAD